MGSGVSQTPNVYEVRKEKNQVTLCAPTSRINGKGDTLGGMNLTVRISAPAPEVIRVQTFHHRGVKPDVTRFELELPEESDCFRLEEEKDKITVLSGQLSLVINKENWSMRYERGGKLLTRSGTGDLAYMKTDWKGAAYDHGSENAYMRQQLGLSVDELIYGLGERFTPFVKNGQSVSIWNEDGGTSTEQSYKNIPFYLSNRGYGVFVNHPEKVEFEVATEQVAKVGFSVKGENLDYFLINGPTMKDVLMRYTDITGKPALPPEWTFGLWLSTSFTTDYDEETVMSFIDGMIDRGIPLSVFHFDCCWMREFHWTDFVWDERVFPDPEGMLRRIREKGIKVCVWINPYIGQESVLFDEGMEKGYFLKRVNGDVWQWDMWQPGLAVVDFTNPEAVKWYQEKLKGLLDMGVDCFKTDFGERIPTDAVYYNGADSEKMHNFYTYLYNKAVYDVLVKCRGREEAVLFARSATVGGQKFPVHWGGDCWSDYESMEQSLRGGLSLTSSGFGFWSHDIGGFESTSTADVYKRWAAFGLLSTHSRFHGSKSYRVPWLYDEEAVDVVRFFAKLKMELLPYLYSNAYMTSRTGIPMLRSMPLEFEDDRNCRFLDKQYMLGDSLLVAPIFNEEGQAVYYLPAGLWTNYLTGEQAKGPTWREEYHGYLSVPLWVRENSMIATKLRGEDGETQLEMKVFGLTGEARAQVYQNEKLCTSVTLRREGDKIHGEVSGDTKVKIRFVGEPALKTDAAEIRVNEKDSILCLSEKNGRFICTIGETMSKERE